MWLQYPTDVDACLSNYDPRDSSRNYDNTKVLRTVKTNRGVTFQISRDGRADSMRNTTCNKKSCNHNSPLHTYYSRNNNAFAGAVRLPSDEEHNLEPPFQETFSHGSCQGKINALKERFKSKYNSFDESKDLERIFSGHDPQTMYRMKHLDIVDICDKTGRGSPKALKNSQDVPKAKVWQSPTVLQFRNEVISERFDEPVSEAEMQRRLSSLESIGNDVVQEKCGGTYLSRDCQSNNSSSVDNFRSKSAPVENRASSGPFMCDDENLDNNFSEESLLKLGHDEQVSAFRLYKPLNCQSCNH